MGMGFGMRILEMGRGEGKTRYCLDWLLESPNRAVVVPTSSVKRAVVTKLRERLGVTVSAIENRIVDAEGAVRGHALRGMGIKEVAVDELAWVMAVALGHPVRVVTETVNPPLNEW